MEISPKLTSRTDGGADILVVDDEASILAVAQAILETVGLTPSTAADGESAVRWVQDRVDAGLPVSLVILDLTMPGGLSGFETLEAMREVSPTLPVIACSGFFAEGARDLCQTIGFTDILAKPYSPEALLSLARGEGIEPPSSQVESMASSEAFIFAPPPDAPSSLEEVTPSAEDPAEDFFADYTEDEVEADTALHSSKNRHPLMKGFGLS